ncbi:MAG: sulfatase-like hydrolase/transferase [Pirellulales bacterium]|nr:sulfatase-like hydrolase/transferase [Pirellulales bacterium]
MKKLLVGCALLVLFGIGQARVLAQPNIVLIMVDDMAYHELGVTGQLDRAAGSLPAIETPNLDALANGGLLVNNFYATPICGSTRGSLVTGFHNGHSSIDRNGGNNGGNPLRDVDFTIAQQLKSAGYTTGQYGKWGLGGHSTNGNPGNINTATITHPLATPVSKGYDEYYGYLHQVHAHDYYVNFLWEHDTDNSGDVGGMQKDPVSSSDYSHDLIADKALQFITDHADPMGNNPFYLYLPFTIPHGDYNPPNDAIRQAFVAAGYGASPGGQADYAAMMKRMDNSVGDVVDRLKDPDGNGDESDSVYNNTVIMFLSDNGGNSNKNVLFNGSGDLRGQKGSVFEGGIKTPFIAHWNGTINPSLPDTTTIGGVDDLFATISDLAGAEQPVGQDGVSLVGRFMGGQAERRDVHVFEGNGSSWSIRMGDWKLVNGNQLYNLPTDASEATNVAAANPAIASLMNQIALDEGVLSDVGSGAAQTTHIVQYKTWAPQGGSTDWNTNTNWTGGTEFNTRGTPANNFNTPPANNWISTVDNTSAAPAETVVSNNSEVLGLDIAGSVGPMKMRIENGVTMMARNGARIRSGATIDMEGGNLHTMRTIEVMDGGTLKGKGTIATGYDTTGTPFTLKSRIKNEGRLEIGGPQATSAIIGANDTVLVDFNSATDVNDFFITKAASSSPGDLALNFNAGGGAGNSGAAIFGSATTGSLGTNNGANDADALYAPGGLGSTTGEINLDPGDTLSLSIKLLIDPSNPNIAATPRLGVVVNDGNIDVNNRNTIGGNNTASPNSDSTIGMLFRTDGDKLLTLRNTTGSGSTSTDAPGAVTVSASQWYQFRFDLEKSQSPNQFFLSGAVDLLTADGSSVANSDVLSLNNELFVNSAAYTNGLFAGFHMDVSAAPSTVAKTFDDFMISVIPATPPAPVDNILTLEGDFTQSATGEIAFELFGNGGMAGIDFDQFVISGVAELAGTLEVTLDTGFTPQAGDSFALLTAAEGVSGGFGAESLPGLPDDLKWHVDVGANDVTLKVLYASDFDMDGDVDNNDLTVWRNGYGVIDGLDGSAFLLWQRQFGLSVPVAATAATVPEPSSLMLVLIGLHLLFARR